MEDEPLALPDLSTYAAQLNDLLRWIDGKLFDPYKAALIPTMFSGMFTTKRDTDHHIKEFVVYRVIRPANPKMVKMAGPHIEVYYVLEDAVVKDVKRRQANAAHEDFNDACYVRRLLAVALAAVRYRVLQHTRLFPSARLRTIVSTYRESAVPGEHRRRLFAMKGDIKPKTANDPYLLDAYILLALISMAEEEGAKIKDTLHYLTNSPKPEGNPSH